MLIERKASKFFNKINSFSDTSRKLRNVMFEINWRCNLDCTFCYLTKKERATGPSHELTTEQVCTILSQLAEAGCLNVAITGGEVFLRKDLFEILTHARRCGLMVGLLTSGYFINESNAKKLSTLGVSSVDISFHANSEEVFDRTTQVKGSFRKIRAGVELLRKHNVHVRLKTLATQWNQHELISLNDWAREQRVEHSLQWEITPRNDGDDSPVALSLEDEKLRPLLKVIYREKYDPLDQHGNRRAVKSNMYKRDVKKLFNCGVGKSQAWINPRGQLYLCREIHVWKYDLLKGSVREGWEAAKTFVDSLQVSENLACLKCDLVEHCGWCPGRSYLEAGNFETCSEYMKNKALIARKQSIKMHEESVRER